MFVRTKRVHQNGKVYEYLLLVETVRDGRKVRQHTVANLGRRDLLDPERIDAMIRGLAGLAQTSLVANLQDEHEGLQEVRSLGGLPIFRRLWRELGLEEAVQAAAADTSMPLAEAAFALVAARLLVS